MTAMYTTYFGLKEKPFSIAPDPHYLYMSELHREALAHLLYGISSDGCFILLTGDVGTGKTTVCRCLLEQLPDNTDVALIVNPRLTVLELLESICDELGIPLGKERGGTKFYVDRLNRYLLDSHAKGRNTALIIDEAQNLSLDLLEQLRLLTNLETDKKKLLKIVLLGQPELKQILEQSGADQISQRITSRYHLSPLKREDVYAYVHHRLAVVGERGALFSDAALSRIYELSCGIPRLINLLCDRSLLGAYAEEKCLVNGRIVDRAAREVLGNVGERGGKGKQRRLLQTVLLASLLFVLGVGAATFYFARQIPIESVSRPIADLVQKMKSEALSVTAPASVLTVSPLPRSLENEGATEAEPVFQQSAEPVSMEAQPEAEEQHGQTIQIVPLEISD